MSQIVTIRFYGSPVPRRLLNQVDLTKNIREVGFHKQYTTDQDLLWFGESDWTGGEGFQPAPLNVWGGQTAPVTGTEDVGLVRRVYAAWKDLDEQIRLQLKEPSWQILICLT